MSMFLQNISRKAFNNTNFRSSLAYSLTSIRYGTQSAAQNAQQSTPKTGIVMLNMGGPEDPKQTSDFLSRLFNDPEIITLGGGKFQQFVANMIVKRRSPKVEKQYEEIGGSPILKWTEYQGNEISKILDNISPSTAPHKSYTMFRYADPLTEETLLKMKNDGIKHAIAFSQYPQWCCNTTGSSMNHLWRELKRLNLTNLFEWSIIDRWYLDNGYINSLVDRIENTLKTKLTIEQLQNENTVILFSAHSIPLKSVTKGDPYVFEVSATVKQVMATLTERVNNNLINGLDINKHNMPHYQLTWQSKVGPLQWMVPSTESVIKSIGKNKRYNNVIVVPFVFTSDHIETLYELDIEYGHVAKESGIKNYIRCPALNDSKIFINALANIVHKHLINEENHSKQYKLRCHDCTNEDCRNIENARFKLNNANTTTINETNEMENDRKQQKVNEM